MYQVNLEKCLKIFKKTYVSTDSEEVATAAALLGAIPIIRGEDLCGDCPNIPVYQHAAQFIKNCSGIIAVQANSPTIEPWIIETVKIVMEEGGRSEVLTCHEGGDLYGSVWAVSFGKLKHYDDPYNPKPDVTVVDTSVDIHTQEDYTLALLQQKHYDNTRPIIFLD